jgi:hypothetical protein
VAWWDTQAFIVSGAATPALRASPFGDTLRPSLAGPKGYRGRGAIMARQPKADFAVLSNVIEDATLHWFVETGVILHPEEFKPSKRFSDYNINMPAFIELYDVVVDKVRFRLQCAIKSIPVRFPNFSARFPANTRPDRADQSSPENSMPAHGYQFEREMK